MNENDLLEELQDIKKLLVLQLLTSGVQIGEIEEILELGSGNFAKSFKAGKLTKRIRQKAQRK